MKRVFFLIARVPFPLDDGWKIRTFQLLRGYANNGWEVDLLSFCEPGQRASDFPRLWEICRTIELIPRAKAYSPIDLLRGLLLSAPFPVHNYAVTGMAGAVRKITDDNCYDLIQVEDVVMAQYISYCREKNAFCVLDMHNVESSLLRRYAEKDGNFMKQMYARLTASKLECYERAIAENFNQILVCSSEDRNYLKQNEIQTPVGVVPNGVDCTQYQYISHDLAEKAIVFVGSMDYHANISGVLFFANHVLPLIRQKYPDIHFYIVGKNPPESIRGLAGSEVTVTGMVPDVQSHLAKAGVVVVPLLVGGGTRLKILEAMACGKPIVSTSLGAEGIEAIDGKHLLLADEPEDFAGSVVALLNDLSLCQKLGKSARSFVQNQYGWDRITRAWCDELSDKIGNYNE